MERITEISSAYDGRPASAGGKHEWRTPGMKPDDGTGATNYGIGGCTIRFILKGPLGAVQFVIYTDWYPPHVQQAVSATSVIRPMGGDVGYHSPRHMYEGQGALCGPGECPYVPDGAECFYDGSSLRADEWVRDILLRGGSDAVWKALEDEYADRFGSGGIGGGE